MALGSVLWEEGDLDCLGLHISEEGFEFITLVAVSCRFVTDNAERIF